MTYIDAVAAAVPTAKKAEFIAHAKVTAAIFKDYGALKLVDCWGDDVPDGVLTSFPMAVKKTADETVIVGWIVWPSKEVRDAGMTNAMQDPRMSTGESPPFDGKRMIFGGFEVVMDE